MAISLLQDAQTRNLAAALAGMKREDLVHGVDHRSGSLSPPMSANTSASGASSTNSDHHHAAASNMYPGLQQAQAAASAFNMFAANRQAAAAFMAAQLPMSTLFPHHPALFGSWANAAAAAATMSSPHMPLSSGPHSPPASPHSPLATTPASSISNNNNFGKHSLASLISPTSSHCDQQQQQPQQQLLPAKKSRKQLSIKKELMSSSAAISPTSPPIEISMSVADLYAHQLHHSHHTSAGPISPPSSGSSPNSTHEGQNIAAAATTPKDPSRDKSFTCKICSRSFGYKHVLQNHERTHTGEKPFECPECHKRFTRDHHLKTHMRLHTGEKPYHCSHCDRQFVQVANLRRHLRVHTGERPYTCEICDGKFSDSNQLKSHMLVHNGEKPFECERCHAKFRRRHHLMNHKCGGLQSPPTLPTTLLPTPAISPAMSSDYISTSSLMMCDQKSVMGSSYGSEESMDIGGVTPKPLSSSSAYDAASLLANAHDEEDARDESPLDLSEDGTIMDSRAVSRKSLDIRRVFRLPPPQIHHILMPEMPVQTEPEDLSVRSPRSSSQHEHSMLSHDESALLMHDNDTDLDYMDDAPTYARHLQMDALRRGICME